MSSSTTTRTRHSCAMNIRADDDEQQACFKRSLGRALRAHGSDWQAVPFFLFVDHWISDDGKEISNKRMKETTKARRKFGLAN